MPYRLRYQAHDLELQIGDFVVGRSTECQLSLDDPLVSRKHAVLRVTPEKVTVQDLGSRNGVLVNGKRVEGAHPLNAGDKVGIGSQEMVFHVAEEAPAPSQLDEHYRRATQTLGAAYVADLRAALDPASLAPQSSEHSKSIQSFKLLGGVADKAFAMNRAEEAERILQTLLFDVLARARDGQVIEPQVGEASTRYAARLAGPLNRGTWVDYCFELYKLMKKPLPASVVDELYTVVRKVKTVDLAGLRAYLVALRENAASFGPADRFLVQRIEGLERLVALK